jgi:hypothetical protein
VIFVTLNNIGVEVVVGHEFLSNKCRLTDIRGNRNPYCATSETVTLWWSQRPPVCSIPSRQSC